jgi:tetratricopeptide (TPR) repeat protein
MYLKGSKLSLKPKRSRPNLLLVGSLMLAIGGLIYLNIVVVPNVPPLLMPTPTPTRDPISYELEAEGLASEGKYVAAVETYKQAVNANPQNVMNYINLAKLQIYTGDYEEAKVNAENAILLNKNYPESYALLAWALGLQGNYLEAEVYIKQGIQVDTNSALAHAIYAYMLALRLSEGLGEIGTVDLAIEESRTALTLDPNLLEARWARGLLYRSMEMLQHYGWHWGEIILPWSNTTRRCLSLPRRIRSTRRILTRTITYPGYMPGWVNLPRRSNMQNKR